MPSYSVTIKQGDHVLHSLENVFVSDPTDVWGVIERLSAEFPTPGLRVIVRDENGDVVIMAGLISADRMKPQIAA